MFNLILLLPFLGTVHSQYDRDWVGVAFSPYTGGAGEASPPLFNSYTWDDVKAQLNVIGSKFSSISTYGIGTNQWNVDKNWWESADSEAFIAKSGAELNRDAGYKKFSINQGIHQKDVKEQQDKEVNNAFHSAEDSNSVFPVTVWGLTFTNEYLTSVASGEKILGMIEWDKNRAHGLGIKVGTRIHVCSVVENTGHELYQILVKIVQASDFIYCNMYPSRDETRNGAQSSASNIGNLFVRWRDAFKRLNPNIEVLIGETGWPSSGKSFNDSPNNESNLANFWQSMAKIAKEKGIKVQMFEGIDEPWKCNQQDSSPTSSGGRFGAECHYGLWYRVGNNGFQEKRG
jgi:exo-beta-1,3-glucanase (GH17 family)